MSAPLDVQGILERAGADPNAPEGSQGWALAQVAQSHARMVEALEKIVEDDGHRMSRRMSMNNAALMFAIAAAARASAVTCVDRKPSKPTNAGGLTRRERTPEQSAERLSARQERMRRKAERRAARNSA